MNRVLNASSEARFPRDVLIHDIGYIVLACFILLLLLLLLA